MTEPREQQGSIASFTATANGVPLDQGWSIVSIDVWHGVNEPSRARLAIAESGLAVQDFTVRDSDTMIPGTTLAIALGYNGGDTLVFSGTVRCQELRIDPDGTSLLVVKAVDPAEADGGGPAVTQPDASQPSVLTLANGESILEFRGETDGASRSTLSRIHGECRFVGSALAEPGSVVELTGLGKRFSGDVYVSAVHHRVTDGQWTTTATIGLPRDSVAADWTRFQRS
jgi:hypothetical protein